jgi:hypothetical protein
MEKRLSAKPKLTLSETRDFLTHVSKHPRLVEAIEEFTLDDKEVARFIARKAKTLYLIASHSNLGELESVAGALFFSAFKSSAPAPMASNLPTLDSDALVRQETQARNNFGSRQ